MEQKVKLFLNAMKTDARAAKLIAGLRIPKTDEEAIADYLRIADAIGFIFTKEELTDGFRRLMQEQKARAAKADDEVAKVAISDEALDVVAGGIQNQSVPSARAAGSFAGNTADVVEKGSEECMETYLPGEWCWYEDTCDSFINFYFNA